MLLLYSSNASTSSYQGYSESSILTHESLRGRRVHHGLAIAHLRVLDRLLGERHRLHRDLLHRRLVDLEHLIEHAVLRAVETNTLSLLVDTHADSVLDCQEEKTSGRDNPHHDHKGANNLHAELLRAAASVVHVRVGSVADVLVSAEDAHRPAAPHAAEAVDDASVTGVVDLGPEKEVVTGVEDDGCHHTDDERHPRVDHRARRGDANQTRERAVETHRDVPVALDRVAEEDRGHGGGRSGDGGVQRNFARQRASAGRHHERGAAVEAVPAEPQDEGAESLERRVARVELDRLARVRVEATEARANNDCPHEAREASDHVHDARAGEVDEAVGLAGAGEDRAVDSSPR